MPGILYHLSFAKEVYRQLNSVCSINEINFMSGNLIPDLATDKKRSHYRIPASVDGFFVPELKLAKRQLTKFLKFCLIQELLYLIKELVQPGKQNLLNT